MKNIVFLQNRFDSYKCIDAEEEMNAIREMLQEMILAALSRTDFFTKAAFHGGTQLRIFEGVRRFSEDLDFSLMSSHVGFDLLPYLNRVAEELDAIGVTMEVVDKSRAAQAVKKGFLKNDSIVKLLNLKYAIGNGRTRKLSIKVEVDANPPSGATYDVAQLFFPFLASVRIFDRGSAFAGKMHALLCREYIKGRDWFDFIWYVSMQVHLNHVFLSNALEQHGPWAGKNVMTDDAWVQRNLLDVVSRIDWQEARRDVKPFVYATDRPSLELWNRELFAELIEKAFGGG